MLNNLGISNASLSSSSLGASERLFDLAYRKVASIPIVVARSVQ